MMTSELARSYAYCDRLARREAGNFYNGFRVLPRPQRLATCALYAFLRIADDLSDEPGEPGHKRTLLARWREGLDRALCGEYTHRVHPALHHAVRSYGVPRAYLDAALDGVEMDLGPVTFATFSDLRLYCYRVASVVGLLSIEIFGYQDPACRDYAIYLGKALQLTNILRDVRTDAERGRIYLPLSELSRFGVSPEEILGLKYSERFVKLAGSVAERARGFYRKAQQTLPAVDRRSMVAAELMGSVYWRLLRKLERQHFNVFGPEPTRLTKGQKFLLILRTWCRFVSGAMTPSYGV